MQDPISFTSRDSMYEAAASILQGKSVTITEGVNLKDKAELSDVSGVYKLLKTEINRHYGRKLTTEPPVEFDEEGNMISSVTQKIVKKKALDGKCTVQQLFYFALSLGEGTKDDDKEKEDEDEVKEGKKKNCKEEDDLEEDKKESFVSDAEKATLDSIIKSLNDSQKLLSTRTNLVKRIIDEMGGTPEDKKTFERLYDKLDDVIDTLDKIKKQIA